MISHGAQAVHHVGWDVDQIALLDLALLLADGHEPAAVEHVIELVGRMRVGIDVPSAGDLELVHQLEEPAVGQLLHLRDLTSHQTGTVPLCSTTGETSSMLRTSI